MQIYILLTENCNLNCSMCIRGKQQGMNMDIDLLEKVFMENDFSEHEIVITGGEPTLHNKFVDVVRYVCNKAKYVTVATNGTNSNIVQQLEGCDNLLYQISLDGDKEDHNAIRGNGSFEKTWETILELEQSNSRYAIASVVSKKNYKNICKLVKYLENLRNMMYWRISYEMPFGNSGFKNIMSADEWNNFVDEILKQARFRVQIQKIFPFDLYEKHRVKLEENYEKKKRSMNCGSGKDKIYIYPNFKVYPCTCLTDFCIGNLKEQTLCEILHGEKNNIFMNYRPNKMSICNECEYLKFCNGGCMGMSYHYFGKLGVGDIRCPKLNNG